MQTDVAPLDIVFRDTPDVTTARDATEENTPIEDVQDDDGAGTDVPDAGTDPGESCLRPAAFQCPCGDNADCLSGYCVATSEGKACTQGCVENCPTGWVCAQVATGPDLSFECMPTHPLICHPCDTSTACKGPFSGEGALCIAYGAQVGHFCGGACAGDADCPARYECRDVPVLEGSTARQCILRGGAECTCSTMSAGKSTGCDVTNAAGTCSGRRTCSAVGLSACDAAPPAAESCNQKDDDCDGSTDEDCDNDGVAQELDNCPFVANPPQDNLDGDGLGDACDADIDGDGVGNDQDCDPRDRTVCPGCAEVCDGKDDDCDGATDEALCDDGNACTSDRCDPVGLCEHTPDNAACDDGNACTGDTCDAVAGCLHTGSAEGCDDHNACTTDSCDPGVGCVYVPLVGTGCDDANLCTYGDACDLAGACHGTAAGCANDPGVCGARRTCNGTAVCDVANPGDATSCNDDQACTYGDHCDGAGGCTGTAANCADDPGLCGARRTCNGTAECAVTWPGIASLCDDNDACTYGDHCNGSGGCQGVPLACKNDPGVCGLQRACDGSASCRAYFPGAGTGCDDGNPCTWGDRCDAAGGCAGTPISCGNDPGPCGAVRTCNGTSACAVNYPGAATSCNDQQACTYNDVCDAAGGCRGTTLDCANDASTCGARRACNGTAQCTVTWPIAGTTCSDGSSCTTGDQCDGGGNCGGTRNCNDNNPCTFDFPNPFAYPPFIPCCINDPQTAACSDNDPTTIGDACVSGSCQPGPKCGNGVCDKLRKETCATCGGDCGACPATETNCTDGWDDDGDGMIDCSDGDCTTVAPCNGATCRQDVDVACGTSLTGQNLSGNDAAGTACGSAMSGSDRVYRFIAPASQNVVFSIWNGGDTDTYDLYVLKDVCNATSCVQEKWSTTSVQLTVAVVAGATYYIVADGSSAAASFEFEVACN